MRPFAKALFVAPCCVLFACAGARTTPLSPTQTTPAAQGEVETRRTDNQNTAVAIEVQHLAPPGSVASGAKTYVVWAKEPAATALPQNLGAMRVDESRKGSLKTKTPLETFEVFVTPESNPNATEPSNEPVLRGQVKN
ncbi:MAG TPA: hypothetical protein VM580_30585 [Labilithrix sp.]|jgi:hypothetical protein|nr:hypothetical protein [Labilithrix sp.]